MKKAPKRYANGTPKTGVVTKPSVPVSTSTPDLAKIQQQALQREKDLVRITKERANTGNNAYFQGGAEVAYSDYTETYPGLYESNNMQPVGKNDLVAQGVTQGRIKAVEVTNPDGSRRLVTYNTAGYKPNPKASVVDPTKNVLPTMIQTAGQTDAEALKNYQKENPQLELKKGGLIEKFKKGGKIKGYENGGQTEDNSKEVAQAVATAAPYVGELSEMAILNKNTTDEYGRIDTGSKAGDYSAGIGAGVLKGAGSGAAAGAAGGVPGMIIGAGLGAAVGGIKGGSRVKADRASIEADKRAEEDAKRQIEIERQRSVFNSSLNKELATRKTGYGYKKGGLIQKCAMGGQIDGDHYGYNVADDSNSNEQSTIFGGVKYKDKGLGGGSSFSAPTAMFKQGGYVKGPGTGTSDDVKAKVEPGSFIVPAKNAKVAEKIDHMMSGGEMKKAPKKKVASINEKEGEEVRLSNGEYKFTPEQREEIIEDLGEGVLEALAPEAEDHTDGYENGTKKGGTKKKSDDPFAKYDAQKKEPQDKADVLGSGQKRSAPKRSNRNPLSPSIYIPTESDMNMVAPKEEETQAQKLKRELEASDAAQLSASASKYEQSNPYSVPIGNKGPTASQWVDIAGNFANLLSAQSNQKFPRKQIAAGTEFLAKSGSRPVDQISPEFQDALNKSQQEAKYGFSAEENALLNQQRLSALNQQREAARLYGLGYQGERQAINESFGRGLQATIANKEKQLQKQMMANQMGAQKADLSRRLFEDKMSAWKQEQQTGGDLIASGLKNQIDAKRYQDVLMNLQLNKAKESNWFNNLNTGVQ